MLSHNDPQENNILMNIFDNENLILIDFEYGGWNPLMMDLGIYVNECMLDNAHPGPTGVKNYIENCPTLPEIETLCKTYLERYYAMHRERYPLSSLERGEQNGPASFDEFFILNRDNYMQ